MSYPNMTAFHTMILFSDGAPLTPTGGSSCSLYNKKERKILYIIAEHLNYTQIIGNEIQPDNN